MDVEKSQEQSQEKAKKKAKKPRSEAQRAADAANLAKAKVVQAEKEEAKRADVAASTYIEPEQDGAPAELMVLRHVYLNRKVHDRTEPQKTARRILNDDPAKFMRLKSEMEAAHKGKGVAGGVGGGPDMGMEKARQMCLDLLREFERGNGDGEAK